MLQLLTRARSSASELGSLWWPRLASTAAASEALPSAAQPPDQSPTITAARPSQRERDHDARVLAPAQGNARLWDWAFVVGARPGRKPRIKRPQRHQWWFCNPNYDPNLPLPKKVLTPHAPPSAANSNDDAMRDAAWPAARASGISSRKHHKEFNRFVRLREADWRTAFHQGLAQHMRAVRQQQREDEEAQRQRAWRAFRQHVFNEALAAPSPHGASAAALVAGATSATPGAANPADK